MGSGSCQGSLKGKAVTALGGRVPGGVGETEGGPGRGEGKVNEGMTKMSGRGR